MNGILVINKPENYTSRDIVNIVGKKLDTKKVGHTGTLDPIATGVLVLTIGRYTKLGNLLTSLEKEYIAEIKLGIKTDTLDVTGNILEEKQVTTTKEEIEKVFKSFVGTYHMEVPSYSAIKVNGKKLYEYARNGEKVNLPIKDVHIYRLELLDFHDDIIKFKTTVEKGTYIRSLIRDICSSLGIIGTMQSLIRTKQGQFELEESFSLDDIKNNNYKLLNIKDILDIEEYVVNEEEYSKIKNGNPMNLNLVKEYILFTYQDKEIALYHKENDLYKICVMLSIN